MTTLLRQRLFVWLGHVRRMEDVCIPKYILYSELAKGKKTTGRRHLRYIDVCKSDIKAFDFDVNSWEEFAEDRSSWRQALTAALEAGTRTCSKPRTKIALKGKVPGNHKF